MSRTGAMHAVIDIGTNSVKLLVAQASSRGLIRIHEESEQTRLGQGFYKTHRLNREAIARTCEAVERSAATARRYGASSITTIATSAVRDASNQQELVSAIHTMSHLTTEVLSGEQEANLVFEGVASDPALATNELFVVDVGGGSSEFILGKSGRQRFSQSFTLGTVRMLDLFRPNDPPEQADFDKVRSHLDHFFEATVLPSFPIQPNPTNGEKPLLIATGGTSTLLAMMDLGTNVFDPQQIESIVLTHSEIKERGDQLWKMPLSKRKQVVGLPIPKADVVLMGVAIVEAIMRHYSFSELRISTRGLGFALAQRAMEVLP
ncbi:MAG: hypothetical protein NTV12_03650 [Verrucomicrobia bacterium]|nr:hypothetical protein [Verrucomicrobiota bacterium]